MFVRRGGGRAANALKLKEQKISQNKKYAPVAKPKSTVIETTDTTRKTLRKATGKNVIFLIRQDLEDIVHMQRRAVQFLKKFQKEHARKKDLVDQKK